MLKSLFAGVSGMKNQQTKMDVIGNNIANVGTTAFKSGRVRFQDIFSQTLTEAQPPSVGGRGGTNPEQVGLGMQVAGIDTMTNQGSLQPTDRPLDCGIQGEGYFILNDGNKTVYTRDGAFSLDKDGNLINSDGYKVMGIVPTKAEMRIIYTDDLRNDGGINWGNVSEQTILKKDSTLTITGPNGSATINVNAGDNVGDVLNAINAEEANTGVHAELVDGKLVFSSAFDIDDKANPALTIKLQGTGEFAGLGTEDDVNAEDAVIDKDCFTTTIAENTVVGIRIPKEHPIKQGVELSNFSIEADGTIEAVYSDNSIVTLGKIALAKFINPGGLSKLGGNVYTTTSNSGDAVYGEANAKGFGDIHQGSLEMSNVDLANEFTDMIITSRAFQANSRTITTSDEMLQELINLKR